MSMISFVKIQAELKRSSILSKYRNYNLLVERLGNGFEIELTFGLHLGWAIEGAIGSYFKFDASYLSPNVNMAARL
jgi:class 3 adenylate cyclase